MSLLCLSERCLSSRLVTFIDSGLVYLACLRCNLICFKEPFQEFAAHPNRKTVRHTSSLVLLKFPCAPRFFLPFLTVLLFSFQWLDRYLQISQIIDFPKISVLLYDSAQIWGRKVDGLYQMINNFHSVQIEVEKHQVEVIKKRKRKEKEDKETPTETSPVKKL